MPEPDRMRAGDALAVAYGFFALAAGARSSVQIATDDSAAPLPYLLSALAAATYLVGVLTIRTATRRPDRAPWVARLAIVELVGVLTIGAWNVIDPDAFAQTTVWSDFGAGYAFAPLALPCIALMWARGQRRSSTGYVPSPGAVS
jgi:cytochrome c biogenesis protein CcdA